MAISHEKRALGHALVLKRDEPGRRTGGAPRRSTRGTRMQHGEEHVDRVHDGEHSAAAFGFGPRRGQGFQSLYRALRVLLAGNFARRAQKCGWHPDGSGSLVRFQRCCGLPIGEKEVRRSRRCCGLRHSGPSGPSSGVYRPGRSR